MEKSLMIVLVVAMLAFQQLLACQAAELKGAAEEELKKDGDSLPEDEHKGMMPVLVLRGLTREDKPDFFLVWMKPYEQFIPKPMADMINQQIRPQTEQISSQMIDNLPGAEQAWSQMSQMQNIINQLGVSNLMNGGGSGSGSGSGSGGSGRGGSTLASLMQNLAGRRR